MCTTKLKNAYIDPLLSTYVILHKDVFYRPRNNVQDKGLGEMTKINIRVCGSQVWPGPTGNTQVT